MITISSTGSFKNTDAFLKKMSTGDIYKSLDSYGRQGTAALQSATPTDSGLTASSWYHEVVKVKGSYSVVWRNSNVVSGLPVAILIQYGHGTGTGGYVAGRDYINPAILPMFDKIANDVWKAVTSA